GQIRNVGVDSGGARRALRERKSTGGDRGGRNKIAPRQVEREACRILSDGIRLCFSWHLGIPFHAANAKVVAVELIMTPMATEISDRVVSDRGRSTATGPHVRRVTKRGGPPGSHVRGMPTHFNTIRPSTPVRMVPMLFM